MMELQLQGSGSVKVSDGTFGQEFKESLVHQVVTACLSGARAGTAQQKSRSQVRGGGIKPWRQKGTGRARAGTIRSPIWRGGGKTFAASPRDYTQKINRKMYRAAMRSILSELVRQERLVAIDSFAVDAPKTRQLADKLGELGLGVKDYSIEVRAGSATTAMTFTVKYRDDAVGPKVLDALSSTDGVTKASWI